MASRGETEEDNQDFGEFVEDRFVELYGLKKIAEANLRDTLKGLKQSSETHTRLEIFRTLTALVPGDAEGESSSQPFSNQAAIFMRQVLGQLVKICREDHLSGMKGDAFWACYAKPDVLKVPAAYFERIIERLNKQVSYLKEQKASAKASAEGEPQAPAANKFAAVQMDPKKEADIIRAIKTLEAVLTDHAKKELALTADKMIDESGKSLRGEGEQKVKEINVGDDLSCKKPTAKGTVGRVCVDSFLFRALEHWDKLMDLEEEMLLRAFGTWDFNGDGHLELKEFTHMVKFSNAAVRQAKVTRAFLAASGGADVVHKERLGPIMLSYGLKLENKPSDYDAEAVEAAELAAAQAAAEAAAVGSGEVLGEDEAEADVPAPLEVGDTELAPESMSPDYRDMWNSMAALGKMTHIFRGRRGRSPAPSHASPSSASSASPATGEAAG